MAVDELCAEISLRVSASPFCRQSAVASRVWAGSSTAMAEGGEGEDEIQFLRTVSKDGSVGSVRVWRALPSISINAVRRGAFVCHNCKCKLFHQVCGGGFTHGGVPLVAAVAPGDRTLVGGMLMWLQVRGKKWLFQTSHSFFSFCRSTARVVISSRRLNHDPLWNRRVSPSSSCTHAHRPLQRLFLLFDADPRSLRGYAQHLSL